MISDRTVRWLSTFSGTYFRRWMEQHYDRLFTVDALRPLTNLDKRTRYGIEAGLYALMAYIEPLLPSRTNLQSVFREFVLDATPEIGRRLVRDYGETMNTAPLPSEASQAAARRLIRDCRETLNTAPLPSEPSQAAAREILVEMDDGELLELLRWFSKATPEQRAELRAGRATLPEEAIQHLEQTSMVPGNNAISRAARSLAKKLGERSETLDAATSKIEEMRERLRKKSKRRNQQGSS